jgi:toxin ParE1/3/4
MKLVWSDEAVFALGALEARLAKQYSEAKAAQVIDELVRRVDRLRDHPQLGRAVPEYGHWQLRELVDKWNRVLYRLQAEAIEIVTVVPARVPLDPLESEND